MVLFVKLLGKLIRIAPARVGTDENNQICIFLIFFFMPVHKDIKRSARICQKDGNLHKTIFIRAVARKKSIQSPASCCSEHDQCTKINNSLNEARINFNNNLI